MLLPSTLRHCVTNRCLRSASRLTWLPAWPRSRSSSEACAFVRPCGRTKKTSFALFTCALRNHNPISLSSALSREVAELQERRQGAANPEDATLVMYKQQAANVLKKKTELMDRETMLAEDRDRLKSELAEKEKEIDAKRKSTPFANKPLAMDPDAKKGTMKDGKMMPTSDAPVSAAEYVGFDEKYFRASELPSPAPDGHFLREFGQSERLVIENSWIDASVIQALALMNGEIFEELTSAKSQLTKGVECALTPTEKATKLWLTVLGRSPTDNEKQMVTEATAGKGKDSWKDLFWALLNGREFIFIQ